MSIVIITGMSGAGKSMALRCLEDSGYYAIDNLPAPLLPDLVRMRMSNPDRYANVAIVMDVRGGPSFEELFRAFDELDRMKTSYFVLFLDATDEVLIRRFSETRRAHPLESRGQSVAEKIAEERKILERLYEKADAVIDTSSLNIHKLREAVLYILPAGFVERSMTVRVTSFGYKFGIPLDADAIIDLRFLPNPYWEEPLREKSGLDPEVVDFLLGFRETGEFLQMIERLFLYVLPLYMKEGRRHVNVAFGCTGGRHRSVAVAEEFGKTLKRNGYAVGVHHRDIDR